MPRKTDEQINEELARLTAIKDKVRAESMFGDNHREAIRAQINVLALRMTITEVQATYDEDALGDKYVAYTHDEALHAHDWMEGTLADDEPPSGPNGWGSLVIPQEQA